MIGKEGQYKKALKRLTTSITKFENAMDIEMRKPSDVQRGRNIAKLVNFLAIEKQSAQHFALGYSFKKIKKLYGKENSLLEMKLG